MRRPFATVLAMLALLTHVVAGAATSLGVVLCIGESHAAIELGADDCCPTHVRAAHEAPTAIERTCCSDVPLHVEASLGDAQRAATAVGAIASLVTVGAGFVPESSRRPARDADLPLAVPGFARRSAALRV